MNIETAAKNSGLTSEMAGSAKFWLADQLMADEHAKLGQGGHTSTQIPLRRVFIDLPVAIRESTDARIGFLKRLIEAAPINLEDPETFDHGGRGGRPKDANAYKLLRQNRLRNRESTGWGAVLLVGGPGQGKSTLGQLACQLHRAHLLLPYRNTLSMGQAEVVRTLIDPNNAGDTVFGALVPARPMLPIHISLPKLMAWVSKAGNDQNSNIPVLLRYVEQLPSASRLTFTAKTMRLLARQLGCLLVLDGFDEVGAARDRDFIVTAAHELLVDLRTLGAPVQVLITTRPQGYAGEMERIGLRLQMQTLQPLQKSEALLYAEKLIQAKVESADQRKLMLDRVKEAADEPATQRLLSTPLQVTILTALVQQLGRAPRERWKLFEQYFSYTYNREIERDTYASTLLSQHRAHVEKIHARIALILQVESESEGGAAGISKLRLEEVISTVLSEDEVQKEKLDTLVKEISKAAEERLVFLVEPEPGKFGFEIRSLQEFMAAHALTSGRDLAVESRLRQISRASMFRNTTLFCASRFFSDGSPLRDTFAEVCDELDNSHANPAERLSRAGALLALETLEEGAVLTQPKRARLLMDKAAELLVLPPAIEHLRLSQVANADIVEILEEKIRRHFLSAKNLRRLNENSVWLCLLDSIAKNNSWALDLANAYKQELVFDDVFMEFAATCDLPIGKWLALHIETLPENSATKFFALRWHILPDANSTWIAYFSKVLGLDVLSWRRRQVSTFNAIEKTFSAIDEPLYDLPKQWASIYAVSEYEKNPSAASLSKALIALESSSCRVDIKFLIQRASWPLSTSLWYCNDRADYTKLAKELVENKWGDIDTWSKWEKNWIDKEFNLEDSFQSMREHPFDFVFREKTPLVVILPVWFYSHGQSSLRLRKTYEFASQQFQTATVYRERVRLAQVCLSALHSLPARAAKENLFLDDWISLVPDAVLYLTTRPRILKTHEWIAALDRCQEKLEMPWISSVDKLRIGIVESKFHPALLAALLELIAVYALHFTTSENTPLDGIDEIGDLLIKNDLWRLQGSAGANAALIILASGVSTSDLDEVLLQCALREASVNNKYWALIAGALTLSRMDGRRALHLKCTAFEKAVNHRQAANILMRSIKAELQKVVSDLLIPNVWDRLGLPLPRPKNKDAGLDQYYSDRDIVALKALHLNNVAGISNLKIEFSIPAEGGQWIVFLGPNGSGKSTLLKSIALATRDVRDPAIWPKGTFANNWIRIASTGEQKIAEALVAIELVNGQKLETVIRENNSGFTINQNPELGRASVFPVYAYGCRRGSALSGGSRAVNVDNDDGPEIATLFDSDANLIHAETWLVSLDGDAPKNQVSKTVLKAITTALKKLLNATEISVRDQRVWITLTSGPDLPIGALSDGYLTSTGWFLDLISRWIRNASLSNMQISPDFLDQMTGLVLIDEIDLHLHPRWQIDVIQRTRRLLPKMSFVVTTHNPLTLVGAAADEIWVLKKNEDQVTIERGIESPALLSGGQLYRRYFGIEDVYPSDVARDVERFGFLLGQDLLTAEDQAEREQLRIALTAAGYVSDELNEKSPELLTVQK